MSVFTTTDPTVIGQQFEPRVQRAKSHHVLGGPQPYWDGGRSTTSTCPLIDICRTMLSRGQALQTIANLV